GLAPALHASKADLNEALKQGGTRTVGGGAANRMRGALVVAEIALSVVLLTGAGLLIKSFAALNHVTLGFQPDRVLLMRTTVQVPMNKDGDQKSNAFFQKLLAEVSHLPGVTAAGATMSPPGQQDSSATYAIDGP